MRHEDDYDSSDVEDRRSDSGPGEGGTGGLGLLFDLVYWLGWKKGLVVFGLVAGASYLFAGHGGGVLSSQRAGHDEVRSFVGFVLDDVQRSWAERIPNYRNAKLVLYADDTTTGCGEGESAVGPFYCPADEKVYLDVTFFEEMRTRLGAPGDFARAYVIAHELGHHLQKLDGTSDRVQHASRSQLKGEGGSR